MTAAPREPMVHDLKTHPEPFDALWRRQKHHEVRTADRDYRVGDLLKLREWHPELGRYSGRLLYRRVTYVTAAGTWGLPANLCVLSIDAPPVWQCSGCHFLFVQPWREKCPECGRAGYWSGSWDPGAEVRP